jgi:hypothetical protein
MNLMPASTLRWQSFNQKKPYLVATVFSLVLVAFGVGFLFQKLAANKNTEIERLGPKVADLNAKSERFNSAYKRLQKTEEEANQITEWMRDRYWWGDFLSEIRRALLRSEDGIKRKLSTQKPGVDAGIWVEQMTAASNLGASTGMNAGMPPGQYPYPGGRYPGEMPPGAMPPGAMPPEMNMPPGAANPQPGMPGEPGQAGQPGVTATNYITLVCRAVSLTGVDPSANSEMAFAVENEIKSSPLVDPKATQLTGQITTDEATGTFTFTLNVVPLNPLKF